MNRIFESFKDIINESKVLKNLVKTNIPKIEKALGLDLTHMYSSIDDKNPDEENGHFEGFALYFGKFDDDIVDSPIMLNIYENGTFQFFFDAAPLGFKSTGHTNSEIRQMSQTQSDITKDLSILFKNSKAIMKDLEAVYMEEYGDDIDDLDSLLGGKSRIFTQSFDWEWLSDASYVLTKNDQRAFKSLNVKPENAIIVFSGAVENWDKVLVFVKKINLRYIEIDDEETGESAIIFDARQ